MRAKGRHIIICVVSAMTFTACRIQPPLHLAEEVNSKGFLGEVELELEEVWGIDEDWRDNWWYGWDETDISKWGELAYPDPKSYELRFLYLSYDPDREDYESLESMTISGRMFRRWFSYGYHDMMAWSNITSNDGTQALRLDESNPRSVEATTSATWVNYQVPQTIYNHPEIFYAGGVNGIYFDKDPSNYDYFDEEADCWVKLIEAPLYPLVYIYVVQVAIYNNQGRIMGISDDAVISNLSQGVTLNSGHTYNLPVSVNCPMRMKSSLPARDGREADILGGKLHTFGLCDMDAWEHSRSAPYTGSRSDLKNQLMLDLKFNNNKDSTLYYDVTDQLQSQSHGGVITIEIDMDTVRTPEKQEGGSFDPVVENGDTIIHIFGSNYRR